MKRFFPLHYASSLIPCLGLILAATTVTLPAQDEPVVGVVVVEPTEAELQAFISLVRADVVTEKATIVAENMEFTEDEAYAFWELYSEYTLELSGLLDARLALIRKHVGNFAAMSNEQARELAQDVFDLEAKRLELKRSWFKKFAEAIPAKKAAQFFQIENQLNAAIDLRVAAMLPLIH